MKQRTILSYEEELYMTRLLNQSRFYRNHQEFLAISPPSWSFKNCLDYFNESDLISLDISKSPLGQMLKEMK